MRKQGEKGECLVPCFRPGLAYSIAFVASIRDESVSKKSRGFAAFTILDRCPGFLFRR